MSDEEVESFVPLPENEEFEGEVRKIYKKYGKFERGGIFIYELDPPSQMDLAGVPTMTASWCPPGEDNLEFVITRLQDVLNSMSKHWKKTRRK